MRALSVAVSPCPNDVFIFGSWLLGQTGPGLRARFYFADVEALNLAAAEGRFDVVKVSAAAAGGLLDGYHVLDAGAAFGQGAGPKLAALPGAPEQPRTVAVPGLRTTALALLRQALPHAFEALPMPYDQVVAAVAEGRAEAGLLIHETALAPERHGLQMRLDLGRWWDSLGLDAPLPLGVILARKDLPQAAQQAVVAAIRSSLAAARRDASRLWPLVRALARELDEATLRAHIKAYVSDLSMDMGLAGRAALARLWDMTART